MTYKNVQSLTKNINIYFFNPHLQLEQEPKNLIEKVMSWLKSVSLAIFDYLSPGSKLKLIYNQIVDQFYAQSNEEKNASSNLEAHRTKQLTQLTQVQVELCLKNIINKNTPAWQFIACKVQKVAVIDFLLRESIKKEQALAENGKLDFYYLLSVVGSHKKAAKFLSDYWSHDHLSLLKSFCNRFAALSKKEDTLSSVWQALFTDLPPCHQSFDIEYLFVTKYHAIFECLNRCFNENKQNILISKENFFNIFFTPIASCIEFKDSFIFNVYIGRPVGTEAIKKDPFKQLDYWKRPAPDQLLDNIKQQPITAFYISQVCSFDWSKPNSIQALATLTLLANAQPELLTHHQQLENLLRLITSKNIYLEDLVASTIESVLNTLLPFQEEELKACNLAAFLLHFQQSETSLKDLTVPIDSIQALHFITQASHLSFSSDFLDYLFFIRHFILQNRALKAKEESAGERAVINVVTTKDVLEWLGQVNPNALIHDQDPLSSLHALKTHFASLPSKQDVLSSWQRFMLMIELGLSPAVAVTKLAGEVTLQKSDFSKLSSLICLSTFDVKNLNKQLNLDLERYRAGSFITLHKASRAFRYETASLKAPTLASYFATLEPSVEQTKMMLQLCTQSSTLILRSISLALDTALLSEHSQYEFSFKKQEQAIYLQLTTGADMEVEANIEFKISDKGQVEVEELNFKTKLKA